MDSLINSVIDILNFLIVCLGKILGLIFGWLPSSPFTLIDNSPIAEYLGYINYFAPINEVIALLQIWVVCIGTYYIYQVALRWIKAIK